MLPPFSFRTRYSLLVTRYLLLVTSYSLLLKKILERLPRVVGAHSAGGSLAFNRRLDGKECALVARVFARDPLCNRLPAFQAAGRIEVRALLAGVQLKPAFRALPDRLGDRGQHRPALCAARHRARPRHVDRSRTEGIVLARTRSLARPAALRLVPTVHVALLSIFAVGHFGPPAETCFRERSSRVDRARFAKALATDSGALQAACRDRPKWKSVRDV